MNDVIIQIKLSTEENLLLFPVSSNNFYLKGKLTKKGLRKNKEYSSH